MQKSIHPWRRPGHGVRIANLAANTRSREFSAYLDTLTKAERQQIEDAERTFIAKATSFISPHQAAARDYARGMLGVKEYEPTAPRGFVA